MIAQEPQVAAIDRYTAYEAAAILGVGKSTIYDWCKSGRMKYSRRRNAKLTMIITGREIIRIWKMEL